jgi:hypothetical protein
MRTMGKLEETKFPWATAKAGKKANRSRNTFILLGMNFTLWNASLRLSQAVINVPQHP